MKNETIRRILFFAIGGALYLLVPSLYLAMERREEQDWKLPSAICAGLIVLSEVGSLCLYRKGASGIAPWTFILLWFGAAFYPSDLFPSNQDRWIERFAGAIAILAPFTAAHFAFHSWGGRYSIARRDAG